MATTPIRPGAKSEEDKSEDIDTETERIINERLATFDEDLKTASLWADVEIRVLQKLKTQKPH